jgi:hypothetical protein
MDPASVVVRSYDVADATGANASHLLTRDRDIVARAVTDALYAESPLLLERHGARGREKCLQDMQYNIDHLIPAVELRDGAIFARYVQWLDELLRARGVETRDVVRSLELIRDQCTARFPGPESRAIREILQAGLDMFSE